VEPALFRGGDSKEALRREIKGFLAGLPPEEFRREGSRAAAALREAPLWTRYRTILLFLSVTSEIDTFPLLETALGDSKKVFAPRTEAACIRFYRVNSAQGPWQYGFFGIREPAEEEGAEEGAGSLEEGDFPALIVTPGLAFDRQGRRLGRGGGYYDRFFEDLDKAGREYCAVGFCLEAQVKAEVPAEETDKPMDGIISSRGFIPVSGKLSRRHD
jgi:5-formyltetrahydrofolate cyclo-ligase